MADFREYAGISLEGYLQHHGILGMIWGKRNGPPYPLDAEDHSAREKKAGRRKSLDGSSPAKDKRSSKGSGNESTGDKSSNKGLSDKQKKAIKTAAVVAGAALAAYGAYKLYQHKDLISAGKKASDFVDVSNDKTNIVPSGPVLGIHNNPDNSAETKLFNKISGEMPEKESIAAVNPHFKEGLDYQMNCGNCAIATELRRRGFDVEAGGNPAGITVDQMTKLCKNLKSGDVFRPKAFTDRDYKGVNIFDTVSTGKRVKSLIEKSLTKQFPANSRGCLFVPTTLGSHWISWEIDASGKFSFINSQNQEFDLEKDFFWMYTNDTSNVDTSLTAIRLDNVDFNDSIKDLVKSRH